MKSSNISHAKLAWIWFCTLTSYLCSMQAVEYSTLAPGLQERVAMEMKEWNIGGLALALIDDQEIVFASGFGEARRDSVFRCGSISKLFNAIAVMQQVEASKLDLDAPLQRYGDDLLPLNPFPGTPAVTLRQILCHRSGLQREAPVGSYFDYSQPSLKQTIASIQPCVLVTKPGEKTRYSNIAPSVAGLIVERVTNSTFEEYQTARLLGPLGMKRSAWTRGGVAEGALIRSHMNVADGRGGWQRREAPEFDLGTIPAGNLYTTVDDLAQFAMALLRREPGLLRPETLKELWTPQLTKDPSGFGLGFMIGKFRDHTTVSHSGSVYGHSSSFVLLPDQKLAVIVLANEDIVNGRIRNISNCALSAMLDAKSGKKGSPPVGAEVDTVTEPALEDFAGDYESESFWAELKVRDGKLYANISGQQTKLRRVDALAFAASSRLEDSTPVTFLKSADGRLEGFKMGAQHFHPVSSKPVLPAEWKNVLGSYGPEFIPVIISERYGHLYAMTENMVDYRLTPVNRYVCALPPGMYVDEFVVFHPGPGGKPDAIDFATMPLKRR